MLVAHLVNHQWFGAERSFLDLVRAVDQRRYRLSCVLPRDEPPYSALLREATHDLTFMPYSWWTAGSEVDEDIVAQLAALYRDKQVDLVHVNTIAVREPLIAAKRLGVPAIVHVRELVAHDEPLAKMLGSTGEEIIGTVQENAAFIVANSNATREMFGELHRSFLLYNAIDVEGLALASEVDGETLRVGLISDNQPRKGGDNVVNLAIFASALRKDVEFVLIGPRTPYVDTLEALVLAEPFPVKLRFVDYCPNPRSALAQLDVLLSLSDVHESFGRTAAEAMAAGRPVIAHATGALPELIRHGVDGFLVPYMDLEAAWAHIETLADRRNLVRSMGEQARRRAAQLFSRAVFAERLAAIYGAILGTSRA